MEHFQKLYEDINVAPLLEQIAQHPELWDAHTRRKTAPQTAHGEMSDIWVRYNNVAPHEESGDYSTFNDRHVPIWYNSWDILTELKPIVFNIMAAVRGEMIGAVLITRIPPGGKIKAHKDDSWHVDYYEKFYVSLENSPGAVYGCEHEGVEQKIEPKPGDLYLFDNRKLHWVENNSDSNKTTLIICIRTDMIERRPQ